MSVATLEVGHGELDPRLAAAVNGIQLEIEGQFSDDIEHWLGSVAANEEAALVADDKAPPEALPDKEKYARSWATIKEVGKLAIEGAADDMLDKAKEYRRRQIWTTLKEMWKKKEAKLDITDFTYYAIVDGHAVAQDGKTRHVDTFRRGRDKARAEAAEPCENGAPNPMITEATRAEVDLGVAVANDQMNRGETTYNAHWGFSTAPEVAIRRDGAEFWRKRIVDKSNLHFLQVFWSDKTTGRMLAGTLSVEAPIEYVLQAGREYGLPLPEDYDDNLGMSYTNALELDSEDQVRQLAESVRNRVYELAEVESRRVDVEDLMQDHEQSLLAVEAELIDPLSESWAKRVKHPVIHDFAVEQLRQNGAVMSPEVVRQLDLIVTNSDFDDARADVVVDLLLYSMMELMTEPITKPSKGHEQARHANQAHVTNGYVSIQPPIALLLVAGAGNGMRAGREYGSLCAGGSVMTRAGEMNESGAEGSLAGMEGSYVAKAEGSGDETDNYGSRYFDCPKGHRNFRPHNKLIPRCKQCGIDVACGNDLRPKAKASPKPKPRAWTVLSNPANAKYTDRLPSKTR